MSSVARSIQVLDLLARRGPLGVRAIAHELALPLGSTHRLLQDFDAEDVVERTSDGAWELSYRLTQIVGIQLERVQLPRLARPILEQLASETREAAFLAVPSRDEIVYLDKVQTDLQLQLNVEVGTRRPMHCTGLGKAILAFLPDAQLEQFLADERHAAVHLAHDHRSDDAAPGARSDALARLCDGPRGDHRRACTAWQCRS